MKQPIRTLANSDDIIVLLAHEGDLSPSQIAEQLDLPRPTVYRLLDGLSSIDFTQPMRDSKARLSLRWLRMADAARAAMREWRGADELLSEVVEQTGQTAYLTVPRDGEAVCIAWQQGDSIGVVETKPGRSLPVHAGAGGRVVLAFGMKLDSYFEANPTRQQFTERTLVTEAELRADVELTRSRGYAISEGDVTDGITAIAVPVHGDSGRISGSLTVSGLDEDFRGHEEEILAVLRDAATRLGHLASVSS